MDDGDDRPIRTLTALALLIGFLLAVFWRADENSEPMAPALGRTFEEIRQNPKGTDTPLSVSLRQTEKEMINGRKK